VPPCSLVCETGISEKPDASIFSVKDEGSFETSVEIVISDGKNRAVVAAAFLEEGMVTDCYNPYIPRNGVSVRGPCALF
jgi:hypothetical protein